MPVPVWGRAGRAALALSGVSLLVSALTLLPGRPVPVLRRHDRRAVHAIGGLLAAGAVTLTLVIGQARPGTERRLPPPGLDSAA